MHPGEGAAITVTYFPAIESRRSLRFRSMHILRTGSRYFEVSSPHNPPCGMGILFLTSQFSSVYFFDLAHQTHKIDT
jgi:hypothetical protein